MNRVSAKALAFGRWHEILSYIGVPELLLSGKHVHCPFCAKKNFRFDNGGDGNWICTCSYGDGFGLANKLIGYSFKEMAMKIESIAGSITVQLQKKPSEQSKMSAVRRVWDESQPVTAGDPVDQYLVGRRLCGIDTKHIRTHPSLGYIDEDGKLVGRFPAMIARITAADGTGATIHRTYLTKDGRKADVERAKKIMPGKSITGGAVRIFRAGATLGIAEGIETALAAHLLFSVPVWSCISAGGIESFVPPAGIKKLIIFADNDESFTGQASAYVTAKKLSRTGLEVEVKIPEQVGTDWCDTLENS